MRSLLITLIAATLTFAQEKPAENRPPANSEAEVIQVKTLTGDSFNRLLQLLQVFHADIRGDNQLRTIVVYAPKDVITQVRRVVDQLDRPGSEAAIGKSIEMTLTLLRCSPKPPAVGNTLPPEMEAVARQLRSATQYKDIQMWDVIPLRLQEGTDTLESLRLPGAGTSGQPTTANITMHPEATFRKDQSRMVRFSRVEIDLRVPTPSLNIAQQFTFNNYNLRTSGDFGEGQKTVLGKISGTGEDEAIFAVITLKVLD